MAYTNHNTANEDISVAELVRTRLPFLLENEANTKRLSLFTLEVMNELEGCFRVSVLPDGIVDLSRVGDEQYYTTLQKSIIADIVAVYILILLGTGATFDGTTTVVSSTALGTFLKKTKAGSVEVEWDQFDIKKDSASSLLGTAGIIDMYRKAAIRKARQLGCIIDICGDCSTAVELFQSASVGLPFINLGGCGCC